MKTMRWLIVTVFICVMALSIPSAVQAEEADDNMNTKFTVKPNIPENQAKNTQSYYDLIVKPGQKQEVELSLINKTDEELTIDLNLANAVTNDNGLIVYNDFEKKPDSSLKVPLTTLIKLPEEHVKVPAKKTVTAKMTVEIPANGFQGLVLGGVYASLAEDEKEEKGKSTGLTSRYGFNVAIALRMSEDTPMYLAETLQLVKLVPTIALGNKSVQAVIQNPTSAIFPEVRLEGKVTKKGETKEYAKRILPSVRFAPNSTMNFHLDFGKEDVRPGTYIFEGKAVLKKDEQQVWPFKQEFTISSQEAKKLNKEAVVKLVLPTWWNQAFYGLLVATIVSLILAIWRFTQQKATLKQQAYLQQEKQAALKNRQGVRYDDNEK